MKIKTLYIISIFFLVSFFFFLGWLNSSNRILDVEIEDYYLSMKSFSFSENLFEEKINFCDIDFFNNAYIFLNENAKKLDKLEKEKKEKNKNYHILKRKHNLNQVLFYSNYKKFYENCNEKKDIVLFFFNNGEVSQNQGKELSKIENTFIIPMHFHYSDDLNYFYDFYDVENLPFIVLNFNKTFSNFTNIEKLKNE